MIFLNMEQQTRPAFAGRVFCMPMRKEPAGAWHLPVLQTVKKVRNRQNRFTIQWIFALWISFTKVGDSKLYSPKTCLLRKDFDLLRNSRSTVPMYADERELLVLRTFSQSGSVPTRVFRHAEEPAGAWHLPVLAYAFFFFGNRIASSAAETHRSSTQSGKRSPVRGAEGFSGFGSGSGFGTGSGVGSGSGVSSRS